MNPLYRTLKHSPLHYRIVPLPANFMAFPRLGARRWALEKHKNYPGPDASSRLLAHASPLETSAAICTYSIVVRENSSPHRNFCATKGVNGVGHKSWSPLEMYSSTSIRGTTHFEWPTEPYTRVSRLTIAGRATIQTNTGPLPALWKAVSALFTQIKPVQLAIPPYISCDTGFASPTRAWCQSR